MNLSVFEAAREVPDAIAVAGVEPHSFAELASRADRWLGSLDNRARGAFDGDGSLIAVVPRLDLASLATLHACIATHTPMLMVHPRSTAAERAALLRSSGAGWLWENGSLTKLAPVADVFLPKHTLAVVPTSGTTGRPKLAVLGRGAFEASARASEANLGWRPDDRWLLSMPLAHVGGLSVLTRTLLARRGLVLPASGAFRIEDFPQLARHGVTLMSVVPTMLHRLLEAGVAPPERLRAVLVGGAAAPSGLLVRAREQGWPVLATYGLTEACSQVATQRLGAAQAGVGPALAGFEVRTVEGELQVRGAAVMTGYLGHPPPFRDGRWLPTGDHGEVDADGNVHIRGRRDDLIITGGENVYPAEVEAAMMDCPGVHAVCVFGIEDAEWGQIVAAAVVGEARIEDVEGYCRERMASHRRPKRMVKLAELPLRASGKIDRVAVKNAALQTRGLRRMHAGETPS